uniref:Uncharacterized protein n=1 Tax=Anguilla anguilla TaxID=7936 RepID=A0A0E9SBC9_ANGAN
MEDSPLFLWDQVHPSLALRYNRVISFILCSHILQ